MSMGTHLGRSVNNSWIKTACGRMVQKRAIALARKRRNRTGKVAFIDVDNTGNTAAWIIASIKDICPKCLANSAGIEMLSDAVLNRLRQTKEIHIELETDAEAVRMCCDKMWAMESMFKNDIGFMSVKQMLPYMADAYSPNAKLCEECLEHPKVQMELLANVEL